jgi:hypothetical protein
MEGWCDTTETVSTMSLAKGCAQTRKTAQGITEINAFAADTCQGQKETDEAAAMFIVEDGGSISNVIIGKAQGEGIHCRGAW